MVCFGRLVRLLCLLTLFSCLIHRVCSIWNRLQRSSLRLLQVYIDVVDISNHKVNKPRILGVTGQLAIIYLHVLSTAP